MASSSSRNHRRGIQIQLCSLLLILFFLCGVAAPVLLVMAWVVDPFYKFVFAGNLIAAVLFFFAFYITAWPIRCKVCTNQLFAPRKCVRHSSVSKFFGSYALWMALTSVLVGWFRCQFCGEKARVRERLGVKDRNQGRASAGTTSAEGRVRHAVKIKDHDW